jgi:predicted DNA-binding transcriptional regulator AlpA
MAWQATKARGQTDPNARRRRLATDRVRGAALVGEYAFERNITTGDVMKKPGEQPKPTDATPRLLTIAQVADRLTVSVGCLRAWRIRGEGPPAIRIGSALRWDIRDVDAWLNERRESGGLAC